MSTENNTQENASARTVNFAGKGFYQLQESASKMDIHDQLSARLGQLSAMLHMTYGAGRESFTNWSDEIQENHLWATSMIADECKDLAKHLT